MPLSPEYGQDCSAWFLRSITGGTESLPHFLTLPGSQVKAPLQKMPGQIEPAPLQEATGAAPGIAMLLKQNVLKKIDFFCFFP